MTDESKPPGEWRDEMAAIADGWLLGDVPKDATPAAVVIPFENADLHDRALADAHLRDVTAYRGLTVGRSGERSVGVMTSKLGGPAVAMALGVLAGRGVTSVVGVGFCGGLRAGLRSGDVLVPAAAVRDEGTSARYAPLAYPAFADSGLSAALASALAPDARVTRDALVWSTDAVLLQSSTDVAQWSALRVDAVDMEVATFFTVARVLGMRAGAALVVSDHPADFRRADDSAVGAAYATAFGAALTVAGGD